MSNVCSTAKSTQRDNHAYTPAVSCVFASRFVCQLPYYLGDQGRKQPLRVYAQFSVGFIYYATCVLFELRNEI